MVAPLLAVLGGVGIIGAGNLFQRNLNTRAFNAMQDKQRVALDGVLNQSLNPPGSEGHGQTLAGAALSDAQIEEVQALATVNVDAARKRAIQIGVANRAAFVADRSAGIAKGNLDIATDRLRLDTRQSDFDFQESLRLNNERIVDERDAILSLTDRDTAERLAAESQRTSITMRDEQGGGFVNIPLEGDPRFGVLRDALRKSTKGLQQVNNLVDTFSQGSVQDKASPIGARQQIDYQFALAELRILLGTGTPQAAELELFARTFPDPQSLQVAMQQGDPAALGAWTRIQEIAAEAQAQAATDARNLKLSPRDIRNANVEAERAQTKPVEPPRFIDGQPAQLDPQGVQTGTFGDTTVSGRAGAPLALAWMAAQVADAVGIGDPNQVRLLREQMQISEDANAPLFGSGAGSLGGLGLDLVEKVIEPVKGIF